MKKYYEKSGIGFAVMWIVIYVVGTSLVDGLNITKGATLGFHTLLTLVILAFLKQQGLMKEFGLCKAKYPVKNFLFFLPLIAVSTVNFWFGVQTPEDLLESIFFAASMVCVGFLEEIIFRGFLFKAMAKDNVKAAIIVSSITFGIGHIINLINGSGMSLLANICQVIYAIAFGYLCVVIFHRGGSLWPCIAAHSFVNATSVFGREINDTQQIVSAAILTVVPLAYALILQKTLPREKEKV